MNILPRIPIMGLIGGIAGPLTRSSFARAVVVGYLGSRLVTWVRPKNGRMDNMDIMDTMDIMDNGHERCR